MEFHGDGDSDAYCVTVRRQDGGLFTLNENVLHVSWRVTRLVTRSNVSCFIFIRSSTHSHMTSL
jgi:hypothetical protein